MKKTAIYYSKIFLEHIVPNGHPENNNRIKFIRVNNTLKVLQMVNYKIDQNRRSIHIDLDH